MQPSTSDAQISSNINAHNPSSIQLPDMPAPSDSLLPEQTQNPDKTGLPLLASQLQNSISMLPVIENVSEYLQDPAESNQTMLASVNSSRREAQINFAEETAEQKKEEKPAE